MATGRCSGCGRQGSARAVRLHIHHCTDYAALHESSPERCLTPEAEFLRFKDVDDTPEARARRRDDRLRIRFAEIEKHADLQARRWATPKDILDD